MHPRNMKNELEDFEDENLKKLAPSLSKIEKKELFAAPENYFEKLPGQLQDKIHANVKPKHYWVPNYKLALASLSVFLILLSGIYYFKNNTGTIAEPQTSELIQNYDSQYLSSVDETELAEQLDDEVLENTSLQIEKSNGISNEEIEDYLLSNNIDLTTISNEF